jgi:hypothetical protein
VLLTNSKGNTSTCTHESRDWMSRGAWVKSNTCCNTQKTVVRKSTRGREKIAKDNHQPFTISMAWILFEHACGGPYSRRVFLLAQVVLGKLHCKLRHQIEAVKYTSYSPWGEQKGKDCRLRDFFGMPSHLDPEILAHNCNHACFPSSNLWRVHLQIQQIHQGTKEQQQSCLASFKSEPRTRSVCRRRIRFRTEKPPRPEQQSPPAGDRGIDS